ncbi:MULTISPECIES: DoxX family protein [unclassified Pseudonocardia]|uniref:DoxX family protein n=1 Tax=unclassified Pseudonocardia TaxID=2619320 RepID=UPI00143A6448|nr:MULTISPECIES: DoxX family protein [unclassified Pseudonocardia]
MRLLVATILLGQASKKLFENGFAGTVVEFRRMGIPLPSLSATFAISVEFLGGIALALGFLTLIGGGLVVVNMLGALIFAHAADIMNGGDSWLMAGVVCASTLLLMVAGPGRVSVDYALHRRAQHREIPEGRP